MAPGGVMFRYPQHFGENVLPYGSHEWLPYSKDEVRLKIGKHRFAELRMESDAHPRSWRILCCKRTQSTRPW